jgi:hypothetical protein
LEPFRAPLQAATPTSRVWRKQIVVVNEPFSLPVGGIDAETLRLAKPLFIPW